MPRFAGFLAYSLLAVFLLVRLLAMGKPSVFQLVLTIGALGAGFFLLKQYIRFLEFLKTQEKIVRILVYTGVMCLIFGLVFSILQSFGIFGDATALARYRVQKRSSAQTYIQLAQAEAKADHIKEAIEAYQKAMEKDPALADAYIGMSRIYRMQGKLMEAIDVLKGYIKEHPEEEKVYVELIEVYGMAVAQNPQDKLYQEKREELLGQYEQSVKRKKYTAADYYKLGFLYEQVGGFEEAIRYYSKALELNPKHRDTLFNLANRYQQMGNLKPAVILYQRLVRLYPSDVQGHLNLGIIYNALGHVDKARYLYQKVIKMDPDNADAYFNTGYLHESAGEYKDALTNYEKAVENNPRHAEAYYNMGNVYAALDQYPEAIATYLKTVGIDQKHQSAYVNLSILSFKAKDFDGAIEYLEQAKALGYNPPEQYLKTLEPYRKK